MGRPLGETVRQGLSKFNTVSLYVLAIRLRDENKSPHDVCVSVRSNCTLRHPKCPPPGEETNMQWNVHTVECHSAAERNGIAIRQQQRGSWKTMTSTSSQRSPMQKTLCITRAHECDVLEKENCKGRRQTPGGVRLVGGGEQHTGAWGFLRGVGVPVWAVMVVT